MLKMDVKITGGELLQNFINSKHDALLGVFKDKARRSKGEATNASILATHVYGSIAANIPKRDPMIEPMRRNKDRILFALADAFAKEIKANKNLDSDVILKNALEELAFFVLNDIIKGEILTNGQGKWQKLKVSTVKRKMGSEQMLIQYRELFNSLSFKVI